MQNNMTLQEAMEQRHSVRNFRPDSITETDAAQLRAFLDQINTVSGLHLQLVTEDPDAFKTFLNHYGWLKNARNYIALVGPDRENLEEQCGYYGEMAVLYAQQLGLSTCWLGGTFSRRKTAFEAKDGEKLALIIAIGYAAKDGKAHKSKTPDKVSNETSTSPKWFRDGVAAALMAPTAINQQKFRFELQEDGRVRAGFGGSFGKVDLGIAKYHFELGSGRGREIWVD